MRQFHRIMLLIAALSWGAGAKVLDTLVIEGLMLQQEPVVRANIGLRNHAAFTPQDIQQAIKNLYKLGYFKSVDFFVTAENDSTASLKCVVKENPTVEVIEFAGNKKLRKKDFEEKMTMKKGMICTDALVYDNALIIKKLYAQKGNLLAEVKTEIIPTKIPGNVLVKMKISDGPKILIKKITFSGNKAFKERKLRWTFKTKEQQLFWGGDFDEEQYRNNLDTLIIFYKDQGFIDARIVHDSLWYGQNKKDLFIAIDLFEGKKFLTGDFFYSGNKVIETGALSRTVLMKKGKPFQKSKFEATKEFVVNSYREEGYLWVQVRDRQSFRGDTVDVTFDITEGQPAIVRKVDITGNMKTKEKVIRREMVIMPGQKYKHSLMTRSVRNIYQLNFFTNVKPDLKPNEDGTVDLEFSIQEKDNIGQLSLGASYSEIDGFMGTFSTSIPNFRGAGQKLDLSFEAGQRRLNVSVGFMEPWAFNTPTTLQGSIYYLKRSYYGDLTQYGISGSVMRKLKWPDDYFAASLGYELAWKEEYEKYSTLYENGLQLQPQGIMSKLSLSLMRDDTDMPKFPTEGSRFAITPEFTGLGGDYKFIKTQANYDWYFPLFWKFVLSTKAKFGLLSPFPGSNVMKISSYDALSAGGSWITDGILRGYDDRTFGGYYKPWNGVALLTMSSEIRFPVLDQVLYLSGFADVGNTWPGISQVNLTDLYPGLGFGIRIDVPMLGLLGMDIGYGFKSPESYDPFNRKANGWKFNFQLGKGY
jgi:outer membrane protein insertion porin family